MSMRKPLLIALMLASASAAAQQYRSEVRELSTPPPEQQGAVDPAELLKTTTDPYARALLLREMAGKAAREGNLEAAGRYLEQALGTNALSGFAADAMREDLAQIYASSGDHKQVIRMLEPRFKANPDLSAEQLVALGAAYASEKRYREAVALLRRGITKAPRPDESWRAALLSALIGNKQFDEAAKLVAELVAENPARSEYWLQWSALLLRDRQQNRATAVMAIAARQGHLNTPEDRMRLVALTAEIGAPFEAGSLLQNWLSEQAVPDTAENWEAAAGIWSAAKEWNLAIQALNRAIDHKPRASLYLQLGQLHMDREEYEQASLALRQAIAMGQGNGAVLMTLGMAQYQTGDVDGALEAFRQASGSSGNKQLAGEWVKYLESGRAREQAMQAASRRAQRGWGDEDVTLADRLGDGPVRVGGRSGRGGGKRVVSSDPYTPVGAERPGNADGSIPAWDGGLLRADWPQGYAAGTKIQDPFPQDQPLFEISARNMAEYGDAISDGHRALMKRYPDYRMPVYPSRRSAAYPAAIYQATQANIGQARLEGSDALAGARLGFPFPKPQNGVEIMWNHRTRYRGDSVLGQSRQALVDEDGDLSRMLYQTWKIYYRYANIADPVDLSRNNILLYGLTWLSDSGRNPNVVALFHETADSIRDPRNIWILLTKIGKMLRIPPVGYDQPFPASEGMFFIDQIDMYNGAFDRYVWKLQGKREMYIPYNSYRLNDGSHTYQDILQGRFINPEATRYERHRVWVIEATERGGKRHVFGKRVFYVEEDTWNIVLVENYDRQGNPWRFQEGHQIHFYDQQISYAAPVITYDLKDGRYFANFLMAEEDPFEYDLPGIDNQEFLPARVKNRYGR